MSVPVLPPNADPLGEALHFLQLTGTFYCRSDFTAPWSLAIPRLPHCSMFHVITLGECWIEVEQDAPRLLRAGTLAFIPHGLGHRLSSAPEVAPASLFDLPREQVSERFEVLRYGGGGAGAALICGAVRFDHPAAFDLIRLLPSLITVDAWSGPEVEWLQTTLRFIAAEARNLRTGGEIVITRLADILVIQAIRTWIASDPSAQRGWLGALRDHRLGHAIRLIHRDPAHAWTLEKLASAAGMSRSAFAARFTALVGEPVMHYVTRWRMNVATLLLQDSNLTVAEVAARVGYESEAAFSRAFKRLYRARPGEARDREVLAGRHPLAL